MLGQPASWQTVCSPSDFTRRCRAWYSGPILARVLIHSGLRSIGVSALRTSRRSSFRPSAVGAWVTSANSTPGQVAAQFRSAKGRSSLPLGSAAVADAGNRVAVDRVGPAGVAQPPLPGQSAHLDGRHPARPAGVRRAHLPAADRDRDVAVPAAAAGPVDGCAGGWGAVAGSLARGVVPSGRRVGIARRGVRALPRPLHAVPRHVVVRAHGRAHRLPGVARSQVLVPAPLLVRRPVLVADSASVTGPVGTLPSRSCCAATVSAGLA